MRIVLAQVQTLPDKHCMFVGALSGIETQDLHFLGFVSHLSEIDVCMNEILHGIIYETY